MVRAALLILGTFILMLIGGAVMAFGSLRFLISLGLKFHDNYEYYGQMPTVLLIPLAAIVGFVAPGVVIWRLHHNRWRVSLRALLISTAVIAVLLGLSVWAAP